MKVKALNLKNMTETLLNYSGNQKEFSKIWNEFYEMFCMGGIMMNIAIVYGTNVIVKMGLIV